MRPVTRCAWAKNALAIQYHDEEWGVPVHDDRTLFEFLILEGAQAGLSWDTILKKRAHYRIVFDNFDPVRVARYTPRKVERLLADPGIVRNRLKVESAIKNANVFLAVQKEAGSFDAYIWQFVGGTDAPEHVAHPARDPGAYRAVGRDEQGPQKAWLLFCGVNNLLCLHAGHWHGQ